MVAAGDGFAALPDWYVFNSIGTRSTRSIIITL